MEESSSSSEEENQIEDVAKKRKVSIGIHIIGEIKNVQCDFIKTNRITSQKSLADHINENYTIFHCFYRGMTKISYYVTLDYNISRNHWAIKRALEKKIPVLQFSYVLECIEEGKILPHQPYILKNRYIRPSTKYEKLSKKMPRKVKRSTNPFASGVRRRKKYCFVRKHFTGSCREGQECLKLGKPIDCEHYGIKLHVTLEVENLFVCAFYRNNPLPQRGSDIFLCKRCYQYLIHRMRILKGNNPFRPKWFFYNKQPKVYCMEKLRMNYYILLTLISNGEVDASRQFFHSKMLRSIFDCSDQMRNLIPRLTAIRYEYYRLIFEIWKFLLSLVYLDVKSYLQLVKTTEKERNNEEEETKNQMKMLRIRIRKSRFVFTDFFTILPLDTSSILMWGQIIYLHFRRISKLMISSSQKEVKVVQEEEEKKKKEKKILNIDDRKKGSIENENEGKSSHPLSFFYDFPDDMDQYKSFKKNYYSWFIRNSNLQIFMTAKSNSWMYKKRGKIRRKVMKDEDDDDDDNNNNKDLKNQERDDADDINKFWYKKTKLMSKGYPSDLTKLEDTIKQFPGDQNLWKLVLPFPSSSSSIGKDRKKRISILKNLIMKYPKNLYLQVLIWNRLVVGPNDLSTSFRNNEIDFWMIENLVFSLIKNGTCTKNILNFADHCIFYKNHDVNEDDEEEEIVKNEDMKLKYLHLYLKKSRTSLFFLRRIGELLELSVHRKERRLIRSVRNKFISQSFDLVKLFMNRFISKMNNNGQRSEGHYKFHDSDDDNDEQEEQEEEQEGGGGGGGKKPNEEMKDEDEDDDDEDEDEDASMMTEKNVEPLFKKKDMKEHAHFYFYMRIIVAFGLFKKIFSGRLWGSDEYFKNVRILYKFWREMETKERKRSAEKRK